MKYRYGVYAGSFNPFHIGHLNILHKAEKLFDEVIVAVGSNPDKNISDQVERIHDIMEIIPNQVVSIPNMLMNFLVSLKGDVTLIRGLRNGFDFNYEQTQLRFLEDMKPEGFDFKVIYIPCDKEFEHISSSAIRAITTIDPKYSKKYVDIKKIYEIWRNNV